jgi:preprotein translocase subunit YajC
MLIRPQQKKQREQQDWLKQLKKGDEVVTTGGIIGKISGLTDNTVTLELQEKVRVKVLRSHIAGKPPAPGQPAPEPQQKS